uniref:Beta-lactamase-related domain-containing protein n=1 Tax=Globodera rostochiensis TaxID=31243 RepID=A0A914HQD0_GLORO
MDGVWPKVGRNNVHSAEEQQARQHFGGMGTAFVWTLLNLCPTAANPEALLLVTLGNGGIADTMEGILDEWLIRE